MTISRCGRIGYHERTDDWAPRSIVLGSFHVQRFGLCRGQGLPSTHINLTQPGSARKYQTSTIPGKSCMVNWSLIQVPTIHVRRNLTQVIGRYQSVCKEIISLS